MTEANGFYVFTLPRGNYTITAAMPDYLPVPLNRNIIVFGRDSTDNNFLLVKDLGVSTRWSKQVEGEISSSPAIDQDGTVYVGSDDFSLYGWQSTGSSSLPTTGISGPISLFPLTTRLIPISLQGTALT